MSDISIFLRPVNSSIVDYDFGAKGDVFGKVLDTYREEGKLPSLEDKSVAIIGVPEERGAVLNKGTGEAADFIRNKLYRLSCLDHKYKVADIGNIMPGHSLKDTYTALSEVCGELIDRQVIPVIIGGSQDLSFAQYLSYKNSGNIVNIVSVDSSFDLGEASENICSRNFVGKIILHQPNYLFNFSNIGYQTYFVGQGSIALMEKLYFDAYRLGQVRQDIAEVEPIVRSADMITFDISAVRASDAPGNNNASPNGFYGEEACQIARYAGISDKVSSFGIYETNPSLDQNGRTAHLAAQMIWYFIDGVYSRRKDSPVGSKKGFVKYRVFIKDTGHEIIFYKSKKTERWWMEVPYPDSKVKMQRNHIIPCSYNDYMLACKEEMPERWWQAFQKLS